MNRIVKIAVVSVCCLGVIIIYFGYAASRVMNRFQSWEIEGTNKKQLSWVPFTWSGNASWSPYPNRAAMFIPISVPGIKNRLQLQFDLGANISSIYENVATALTRTYASGMMVTNTRLYPFFWKRLRVVNDFKFNAGNTLFTDKECAVYEGFGDTPTTAQLADTGSPILFGTLGEEAFAGKTLILDYPNQRFAICDAAPAAYSDRLTDIDIDGNGKIFLPMLYKGKTYSVLFDNGSSLFPLLLNGAGIKTFTDSIPTDSFQISSWGHLQSVYKTEIRDTFTLAGIRYPPQNVYYSNHSGGYGITTGNALFWNNVVVIDFKRKKFGVF